MNDYAIPDNALFLKVAKFSETDLLILGMLQKNGAQKQTIGSICQKFNSN